MPAAFVHFCIRIPSALGENGLPHMVARNDLIAIIRENMRQVQEETRKAYRQIKEKTPAI
jgi:hypothetical protein